MNNLDTASDTLIRLDARRSEAQAEVTALTAERRRLSLENIRAFDSKRGAQIGTITAHLRDLEGEIGDLLAIRETVQREVTQEREQANEELRENRRRAVAESFGLLDIHAAKFDAALQAMREACADIDHIAGGVAWMVGRHLGHDSNLLFTLDMKSSADIVWGLASVHGLLPQAAFNGWGYDKAVTMIGIVDGYRRRMEGRIPPSGPAALQPASPSNVVPARIALIAPAGQEAA